MQASTTAPSTNLRHKTALVTGGSRGIGRDIALRLAEAGADVILTYRDRSDAAAEVVEQLRGSDRRAEAVAVDLTGTSQIASLVERVTSVLASWKVNALDILVNNAGVSSHQAFASITEAEFDRVIDINFKSVVFLTQALVPQLADGGRIIAIGSGLSRFSMPGRSLYGSLKAAVERYMAYLATELGPRGITANAISPGALDTDFNAAALKDNPQMRGYLESVTALGRLGVAEDVGGVVAMLCSPAARWITGQRIEVSGGMFL
ncbi:3-oxoacyl-[acyl-carrier-protein] reductase FabG [Enhygromyxa salina]|uniref:3-oxoacyl-[acyl-carrier-protein] reductase FabG n=1 Tax=Enhygromyxa salina TaxID=215803 RepID=A0A2S9YD42_9BACT|nr:SDR family oxidoreductase [Enhygromyxa salina]PRQ03037.1 3-oxoacyl-[acyl-carrier-protein] reductase FabG [Enhygromyxa salina]